VSTEQALLDDFGRVVEIRCRRARKGSKSTLLVVPAEYMKKFDLKENTIFSVMFHKDSGKIAYQPKSKIKKVGEKQ
jgi:hypothetical protein